MLRIKRLGQLTLLVAGLIALGAQAHGLDVMAQQSGQSVSGLALYSDGSAAQGLYVELRLADDAEQSLAEGKTDAEGRFSFPVTTPGLLRVMVEGEEGHRAQALVSRLPEAGAGNLPVQLLREDIARLEQRLWWRDVIGGIGYLLGILGIWALWRGRAGRRV